MRFTVDQANASATPLARLLGMRIVALDTDQVIGELTVAPEMCTLPTGLHGGAIMALADNTAAVATMLSLPEGATGTTTIESKTNFFAPAPVGAVVRAVSTPLHRGRRTQVWQTRVEREGKLIASVTQTQMVLWP